jgi:phosphate transport system ATP-binding protein
MTSTSNTLASKTAEALEESAVTTAEPTTTSASDPDVKLAAKDLVATYDGKTAVIKDVTMDVLANRVTAIIGPSGCGKSTFLRCLNRLHEMLPGATATGAVYFDGTNIYQKKIDPVLLRRRIGMVFQKPNPFPTMSIRDNVLAGLKLTGRLSRSDADEIVERSLTGAALWDEVKDKLDKPGTSLSGGQQQRLCIARTIAVEPDVILMDEPCSALDPVATAKIEDLIDQLKVDYTVIMVTHSMHQASRVSDKTAFFLSGELVEYSPTDVMFTSPKDSRTEDYITGKFG